MAEPDNQILNPSPEGPETDFQAVAGRCVNMGETYFPEAADKCPEAKGELIVDKPLSLGKNNSRKKRGEQA